MLINAQNVYSKSSVPILSFLIILTPPYPLLLLLTLLYNSYLHLHYLNIFSYATIILNNTHTPSESKPLLPRRRVMRAPFSPKRLSTKKVGDDIYENYFYYEVTKKSDQGKAQGWGRWTVVVVTKQMNRLYNIIIPLDHSN